MTTRLRWLFLFATLLVCGCDHHRSTPQNQANAVPPTDSEYTGLPPQPFDSVVKTPPPTAPPLTYTNAAPVALAPPALTAAPPPSTGPAPSLEAPPPAPAPTSAPPPAPADNTTVASASPPPAPAESAPADTSATPTSTPAPSPDTSENPPPATPAPTSSSTPVPPVPADMANKLVVIETSYGRIVIELDDFAAPRTCRNFRQLTQDGFYNNTVFHRVIPNFIIQGGDPRSKSSAVDRNSYGMGGPGYTVPAEIALKHDRGAVAMARLPDSVNPNRDSNGSQFYICLASSPALDDQYTVFGHVVQGLDVADKIAEAPRDQRDNPRTRVEMTVNLEPKDHALSSGSAANP